MTRFNSRIADNIGLGLASTLGSSSLLKNIRPINATYWTKLERNKLTIKIDNLLHTRFRTFNDEYMIVPLSAGNHTIYINIICEEYENRHSRYRIKYLILRVAKPCWEFFNENSTAKMIVKLLKVVIQYYKGLTLLIIKIIRWVIIIFMRNKYLIWSS